MYTKHQIERLNRRAENKTKMHFVDGIDWDCWRFIPAKDGNLAIFTDGHDRTAWQVGIPDDGWVLTEPVVLTPEETLAMLVGLEKIHQQVHTVAAPARRADRDLLAANIAREAGGLEKVLQRWDS